MRVRCSTHCLSRARMSWLVARQYRRAGTGATFELMTGVGASHGLLFERTDDFLRTVLTFLEQHPLASEIDL
jgi:hypothetical protein